MRKLCLKWVPRLLTVDQKPHDVYGSVRFLKLLKTNKANVIVDETGIRIQKIVSLVNNRRQNQPENQMSVGKLVAIGNCL